MSVLHVCKRAPKNTKDVLNATLHQVQTNRRCGQGIRHFAPSCVLEDLRLACLQRRPSIVECFEDIPLEHGQPLDYAAFEAMLQELGLAEGVEVHAVFDLLDIKIDGTVTVGRLVAALQSSGPGALPKLPDEERDIRAKQEGRLCVYPAQKVATELKSKVRTFMHDDPVHVHAPQAATTSPRAGQTEPLSPLAMTRSISNASRHSGAHDDPTRGGSKEKKVRPAQSSAKATSGQRNKRGGKVDDSQAAALMVQQASAPRLLTTPHEELSPYVPNVAFRTYDSKLPSQHSFAGSQQSWAAIWHSLVKSPGGDGVDRYRLQKDLHNYFQMNTTSLSHDVPLLQDQHSRLELHQSTKAHVDALSPHKMRHLAGGKDK
eukprot:TRINITY_DN6331_c0_g1_i1.p1 TRINITY_DN6331_c0_g1~~TRINITY_DN6331_c0_g1_i1.p1  ORF type:complete len:374 (+),score=67.16 TRINITY_DN6331_c0_g1_i1:269-1390(+)